MRHFGRFPNARPSTPTKPASSNVVRRERYQNEHIQALQHGCLVYAQTFSAAGEEEKRR
jgi:hypothetical protein